MAICDYENGKRKKNKEKKKAPNGADERGLNAGAVFSPNAAAHMSFWLCIRTRICQSPIPVEGMWGASHADGLVRTRRERINKKQTRTNEKKRRRNKFINIHLWWMFIMEIIFIFLINWKRRAQVIFYQTTTTTSFLPFFCSVWKGSFFSMGMENKLLPLDAFVHSLRFSTWEWRRRFDKASERKMLSKF